MSRVSFEDEFNLGRKIILGSLLAGAMLPITAFAQSSGVERPINSNQLPFLREASSGEVLTVDFANNSVSGGNSSDSSSSSNTTKVLNSLEAGGLISQANNCRFKDIAGTSAEVAINYLYDKGIAGGRRACYFDPNLSATRAEATAMAVRAVKTTVSTNTGSKAFPDINLNSWSANYIEVAKKAEIVHGYPDGLFRAEKPINVVESLKVTVRAFKTDLTNVNKEQIQKIKDVELSQWYIPYVQAGLNEGIILSGAEKIDPATQITRAELAEMIYILMKNREE